MARIHTLAMTADVMLAEARRLTGIDITDEEAALPLQILIESYNADAGFTEEGAQGKHQYIMRCLINRLRMKRDLAAHPEILEVDLKPPVVLNGMARTGTTKMQKVLAATGDFNWLPYWQVLNSASETGVPDEDVSNRINDVDQYVQWFNRQTPDAKLAHDMTTHEPEEDSFICAQSLVSLSLLGFANAPSYAAWCMKQNTAHQFHYLRDTLKYLIWQGLADPERPFVLKGALTYGFERYVLEAFPDAFFVMTHRDPRQSVASTARMTELFWKAYSDIPPSHARSVTVTAAKVGRQIKFRKQCPDSKILDVDYRVLARSSGKVIQDVYQFIGMDLSDRALANVTQWEVDNPKNKHGGFRYTLEDFGINPEEIDGAFVDYINMAATKGITWVR